MRIGIPKEIHQEETRVAAIPETVAKFVKAGFSAAVESGAGFHAHFSDPDYEKAGASIVPAAEALYESSDIVLKVQRPLLNPKNGKDEADLLQQGSILISFLHPLVYADRLEKLNARRITSFAVDMIPRIARAQKLDALSSQSNVAGYKAVLLGANALGKMMPLMMTAAGTIFPVKVFVIGAGVAGLQAVATAKRLGAVVEAFDTRPAVKEQVESLGGRFVQLDLGKSAEDTRGYARELTPEEKEKEKALIAKHVAGADLVITTALVPGKKAPLIISSDVVKQMKPGSVIVDLAADAGGNCELTQPGAEVEKHGVKLIGFFNMPGRMAPQSSALYAKNIYELVMELCPKGQYIFNLSDPIQKESLVTKDGQTVNEFVLSKLPGLGKKS